MLLTVNIEVKTIGNNLLFDDLRFTIEANEKVALIGRNGIGKTTLFHMLDGSDTDFAGSVQLQRGLRLVSTAQEHHHVDHMTALEYILDNLPEYARLKHIIDTYPETMGDNIKLITTYSTALQRFGDLDYYSIEDKVLRNLEQYQISSTMATAPLKQLSGGQKRFVELVRVEQAIADVALIDEPTNHMDYAAKAVFVEWLKSAKHSVVVISHDRDVLQVVDKIIEIKDGQAHVYKGNYDHYLRQNAVSTAAGINDYQVGLKTLDNLQRKIMWARARKPSWHGTADQRNPFKVMEDRLQREYDELKRNLAKPSFWIDRESAVNLPKKVGDNYHKFKAKNIQVRTGHGGDKGNELLRLDDLQLGYNGQPLFAPINMRLQPGDRMQIVGRNGVGKTTLVKAIMAAQAGAKPDTQLTGSIICATKLRLGVYEQELTRDSLGMTLIDAIEAIHRQHDLPIDESTIKSVMGDYLFDAQRDGGLKLEQLSGGQKARLQLIRLLAGNPNMLILDEPTNHLDLPSIEELENALQRYHGALLFVSHDSYFAEHIGDATLTITPLQPKSD